MLTPGVRQHCFHPLERFFEVMMKGAFRNCPWPSMTHETIGLVVYHFFSPPPSGPYPITVVHLAGVFVISCPITPKTVTQGQTNGLSQTPTISSHKCLHPHKVYLSIMVLLWSGLYIMTNGLASRYIRIVKHFYLH